MLVLCQSGSDHSGLQPEAAYGSPNEAYGIALSGRASRMPTLAWLHGKLSAYSQELGQNVAIAPYLCLSWCCCLGAVEQRWANCLRSVSRGEAMFVAVLFVVYKVDAQRTWQFTRLPGLLETICHFEQVSNQP